MSHCADVEWAMESDQLLHPFDSNFDIVRLRAIILYPSCPVTLSVLRVVYEVHALLVSTG
ncbi:hypothetical protein SAMD00019534_124410 [Acytostelium subglobosum LB1]|uniref:hypothetical protein n=1 Tax=Acytostelium subglobosum LB1 TaxID=1410327 RepID=UPI0006448977|nr:hypothetical protein SAMD00019534_124410 [Acytostelium subglobosum LB1]GAM29265.1 hypothetical protein SAMD00019534_124410 [Acytostelium subglobosum LB1]|eukprot:XP_012747763.1 hypothetical protein SAMD00019534_124410 [Acytostelium subglobosum LB1]